MEARDIVHTLHELTRVIPKDLKQEVVILMNPGTYFTFLSGLELRDNSLMDADYCLVNSVQVIPHSTLSEGKFIVLPTDYYEEEFKDWSEGSDDSNAS